MKKILFLFKSVLLLSFFITIHSSGLFSQNPGSLDTTFGSGGIVKIAPSSDHDFPSSMAIQSDGKIVVAGYVELPSIMFGLVRLNTDGSLDTTFGANGIVSTSFPQNGKIQSIAIQDDGKIVAAGYNYNGTNNDFALARYNPNGDIDSTFGTNGKVQTNMSNDPNTAYSVALQQDGKIVALGTTMSSSQYYYAIARYNSNGVLDATFSGDGYTTSNLGGNSEGYAVAIQNDGKIIAAGLTEVSYNNDDFSMTRYNIDGTTDTGFGVNGNVTTGFGATTIDNAKSVIIQPDGKIILAGYTSNAYNSFALARYNSDGTLDNTFGTNGLVWTHINSTTSGSVAALQSDGKIIVAGTTNYDFAMARYNSNGTLDNTFGTNGIVITPVTTNTDEVYSVAIQTDGKILLAGKILGDTTLTDFGIVRYWGGNSTYISSISDITVELFPNPSSGKVYVQAEDIKSINVFDARGVQILMIKSEGQRNNVMIDLGDQLEGLFFIKVETNNGFIVEKIILE